MAAIEPQSTSEILKNFDQKTALFLDFKNSCQRLVAELLRLENISVHSVTARVKERPKLEEKLEREGKNYNVLDDVTDVVGVRIITHFEDEVDKVGSLIEREFVIDQAKSADKRKLLDPDRFGYLSLHYICALSADRLKLAENRRFSGLVCEVQIRSILQHAWAEIEHDLGYKSGHGVPSPIRRRFSRLAGLLEVADREFAAIKNDLQEYESKVKLEVKTAPAEVGIDKLSLKAILLQNTIAREIDEVIASRVKLPLEDAGDEVLQFLTNAVISLEVKTIQQLLEALKHLKDLLIYEAHERLKSNKLQALVRGASLIHFFFVTLGLTQGESGIAAALKQMGQTDENAARIAQEMMAVIRQFQANVARAKGTSN